MVENDHLQFRVETTYNIANQSELCKRVSAVLVIHLVVRQIRRKEGLARLIEDKKAGNGTTLGNEVLLQ